MNMHQAYLQTSVNTAKPQQLLIMLFNGLITFLHQAKGALEQKDLTGAHASIINAQNIVMELRTTLEHEHAPELAQSLEDLYAYFYNQLIEANVKKSAEPIDGILPLITELKSAFQEASLQLTAQGNDGQ